MKIEVVHLHRRFGETLAVNDVSFTLDSGRIYGFVGPNGAGKTTTMRIMASLDEPTSGDVLIGGVSVVEEPEKVRSIIGFMPDSLPAHRDMTVAEYIDFYARSNGLFGPRRRAMIQQVTEFTGIGPLTRKNLKQLSKGMKQRASLARALIHNPQFLIMDEPAAGLDPKARIELRELIRALAEEGKTIFISSHILGELSELCHGTVILEQGCVRHAGSLDEVLQHEEALRTVWVHPLDPLERVCRFLLEHPLVHQAEVSGNQVRCQYRGEVGSGARLLTDLVGAGYRIEEFRRGRADLEEVFMRVTEGKVQ